MRMEAVTLVPSSFLPSLACYLAICSVDLVSLCLLSQWFCYADWVLFDLS